jgi:hypothetical protein
MQHASWLCWCADADRSTETVERHREGQVETCHVDGLIGVKDGRETWTERPR